jgi:zona occludens toxin
MTIELITGTPGAGKTTFAVATRIAGEVGRKIKLDDETCLKLGYDLGQVIERRIVVSGVRGLKIEHERVPHILTGDATPPSEVAKWNAMQTEEVDGKRIESDNPVYQRLPGTPPLDVLCIVQNWWLWVKPGDLLVIDEAQFVMPRGSLGRKPPYWLQAFEIHRHYGIDVIVITQHPQLIDTTVRALVGIHRHVRSVMGSPVCMVYVWDHAANPERFNLANKTTFIRRKKHYKLFHSSAAHVKPPTSGRAIFVIVPTLLVVLVVGVNHFKNRFSPPVASVQAATLPPGQQTALGGPSRGLNASVPVVRGCWAVGPKCSCIGDEGRRLVLDDRSCRIAASSFDGFIQWEPSRSLPPPAAASAPVPARAPELLAKVL